VQLFVCAFRVVECVDIVIGSFESVVITNGICCTNFNLDKNEADFKLEKNFIMSLFMEVTYHGN
jgi:hypothetical protein